MDVRRAWSRARRLRLAVHAAVAAASVTLLAWGLWPPARHTQTLKLGGGQEATSPADNPPGSSGTLAALAEAANPHVQSITLEYPAVVRVADGGLVRLTVDTARPATASRPVGTNGDGQGGASVLPGAPPSHNLIAEARLELPGAQVQPYEEISAPLVPGDSVEFLWKVNLPEPKRHQGTAWFFVVFVEKRTHTKHRVAFSAQSLQIEGRTLLGMSGVVARAGGGLGFIATLVLALPLADELLRRLPDRLRALR